MGPAKRAFLAVAGTLTCAIALVSVAANAADKAFAAPGTHRMVEVVYLASRSELVEGPLRWAYDRLIAQGIHDSEIVTGSVALGRVYCCKGDPADDFNIKFYAPPDLGVEMGDLVEIALGVSSRDKEAGQPVLSVAVRRRERANDSDSACRWDPEQPLLWMRVIRCDWMEAEGWLYQGGLNKTWYKPGEFEAADFASTPRQPVLEAQEAGKADLKPAGDKLPFLVNSAAVISSTLLDPPALHIAEAADALWVFNGSSVSRVDASSGAVTDKIDVGTANRLLGYAEGSIWVGTDQTATVDRYDAATGERQASFRLKYAPALITAAADSLWISTLEKGRLFRLDPETNEVTGTVKTGRSGGAVIEAFGSLWVTDGRNQIVRVDPMTGKETGKLGSCYGATMLRALEGSVWVTCTGAGEIAEIDPETMTYGKRPRVGGFPFEIAGRGDRLWYRDVDGKHVYELDKLTGETKRMLSTQSRSFGLISAFDSLWLTDQESGYLYRIDVGSKSSE